MADPGVTAGICSLMIKQTQSLEDARAEYSHTVLLTRARRLVRAIEWSEYASVLDRMSMTSQSELEDIFKSLRLQILCPSPIDQSEILDLSRFLRDVVTMHSATTHASIPDIRADLGLRNLTPTPDTTIPTKTQSTGGEFVCPV